MEKTRAFLKRHKWEISGATAGSVGGGAMGYNMCKKMGVVKRGVGMNMGLPGLFIGGGLFGLLFDRLGREMDLRSNTKGAATSTQEGQED